jgi:hypothetical protein
MSTAVAASPSSAQTVAAARPYNYALGYLKAFIIALVVAHHASLAYHPLAPPPPASLLAQPRWWQAFPVVDSHRAAWVNMFATFNDIFFMALMFFVSGLFVWQSLTRKGAGSYLRDRLLRLGLPFIPVAFIVAPLSYYPTYLQVTGHSGFADYVRQWISLGRWSAGPAWFLWVLLVFDLIAVLLFLAAPRWGESVGRLTAQTKYHPALFFGSLVAISAVAYALMTLAFGPFFWASWGPFTFQTCRILHYFVYFVAGIAVGAWGIDGGLLSSEGKLAARWRLWVAAAPLAFLSYLTSVAIVFSHPIPPSWRLALLSAPIMTSLVLFALSCAASSFAVMAVFVRFARSRSGLFDSLARNAFGIFLVHFVFVSWLGYALLGANLPVLAKFLLVFAGALGLSWIATALLRRIPGVARVL